MGIKVAFIGAGSVGFTRGLMRDILAVPELADTHFALTDTNKRNLDMVVQLCRKDIAANKLPATLSASVNVQRMAVRAAVAGDVTLLKQAVLHDPLTAAVCSTEEVWQMVDEMLVAQAAWLPQYRRAIPAARRRLAKGPRVKTRRWRGAARLRTRSVAELRRIAARRK